MNLEIVNAMSGYIETLYYTNIKLVRLCGLNYYNKIESECRLMLEVMQDIPRIIPYSYSKSQKKDVLKDKDGLLEFKHKILYLQPEFETILKNNLLLLEKIRKIRNKYEHKMHDINYLSSSGDNDRMSDYVFEIDNNSLRINILEVVSFMKQVNSLFSKIVDDIKLCAEENNKENHPYYSRLTRFDFKDFNAIYESNVLTQIGRILYDF